MLRCHIIEDKIPTKSAYVGDVIMNNFYFLHYMILYILSKK